MLSSNARAEFDSAELDFGLWTAVFSLENQRSSLGPSRSSSTCQNIGSETPPPLLLREPWLASKPTLILGTDTGIFVLKLQVALCQWLRAEHGEKQSGICLLFRNNTSGVGGHLLTQVYSIKAPPPPPLS